MEGVRGSIPLPPTIKIKDLRPTSNFAIVAVSALCPHIQCRTRLGLPAAGAEGEHLMSEERVK